ncbi:aminodeoxychorismate/anthranilate synthase component II [Candidatus Sulfidibacterium hydrothermale]|uniref:anthranilate synthase component II n=1 Tax=Candidatus Sulfidibacterium hydrothermale TaxID=2875962 RepID=UPI001F0A88AE|nr:aminodeoxychorismate/anthranilate synthase component II [Candidatus Sulfidibacterium hydrothermale]UBM63013.1 aminodeoxychorismate/anthranilate synthase component II [Candidatus Sulfidibacterium hydrothermale]
MKKVLVLDNYDSFTYNLVHFVREHGGCDVDVHRNDRITVEQAGRYDYIILSPGPGLPADAGIMEKVIERYVSEKKIFGVCLGMQAIAEVLGGRLTNLSQVYHGVATPVFRQDKDDPVFEGIPQKFTAGRYHSWVVSENGFPPELLITSRDSEGRIMSVRHREHPVFGLQFHPESILTPQGKQMIDNFLNL